MDQCFFVPSSTAYGLRCKNLDKTIRSNGKKLSLRFKIISLICFHVYFFFGLLMLLLLLFFLLILLLVATQKSFKLFHRMSRRITTALEELENSINIDNRIEINLNRIHESYGAQRYRSALSVHKKCHGIVCEKVCYVFPFRIYIYIFVYYIFCVAVDVFWPVFSSCTFWFTLISFSLGCRLTYRILIIWHVGSQVATH